MMNTNSDNSDIDELDSNGLGDASSYASRPTMSSEGIEVELDQEELSRGDSSGDMVAEIDEEDTRQSEQQLEEERKKISKARR